MMVLFLVMLNLRTVKPKQYFLLAMLLIFSEETILDGLICVSSEAVGAMEKCYQLTIEYTKQREQFGQPLSKFQALQHRMVDMFMEAEFTNLFY